MATAFDVLAEPSRRRILDLLLERERSVSELVQQLGLSQPGVSKHLRVLREAGLVRVRQDAQRRWYQISPAPLAEIDAWLQPYRRYWNARLDDLERHLDTMTDLPTSLPLPLGERWGEGESSDVSTSIVPTPDESDQEDQP
jgi:DNA-binding transcriptional ArsR family regulator